MENTQVYHEFLLMDEIMDFKKELDYKELFGDVRLELVDKGYIVLESSDNIRGLPKSVLIGIESEQIFILKVREDFFSSVKNKGMVYFFNGHYVRESLKKINPKKQM